ncbi:bifunctional adenosylcobinamide kinase/adenosylcobinamide-phosphate guanylyltransferase [Crocosphaera sp. UHCC 0190]|uniref:bifunctional adenosylcobinamide kinase/adenosylcobinamide-phosphate guanylyltransferase n=1 Tax=Crocosphaera sp. UHCC 0190 TaxID=3110246 RepID=UPI002B21997C|nr:bifunctional adenosylcobinamide kinase/adenosylcobinamide-phosphate guanylyltransferase [Crocosphaera sp. UHCC 0190]MEA5510987.1 bifunctional adenosylcobinamide kinase/adenosylcobinamide-phosphate guanylyltransferase [Crocosphaera sp. UHCC 0190]
MIQQRVSPQHLILVTGAARSGKSEWAETLARKLDKPIIYVATALENPDDPEWQTRLENHRRRRPPEWQTLSVPYALAATIEQGVSPQCLLIDSLGTWVANGLEADEATWQETTIQLLNSVQQASVDLIFVAEETGWGVVPAYPLGRQFRDRLGHLTRQLGTLADTVYLVVGGHALNLSVLGQPLKKVGAEGY